MIFYKPLFRTLVLSLILAFLLVYLGIKYHWTDYFSSEQAIKSELKIPHIIDDSVTVEVNELISDEQEFTPEIINRDKTTTIIESMNKEQIAELCTNLLSRNINDDLSLELAVVNCVVSNYQETYQNVPDNEKIINQKNLLSNKCGFEIDQLENYSMLEKQLLLGICVSDNLSQ